jgi:hypothetical protein
LKTRKRDLLHPNATRYINNDKTTRPVAFEGLQEDATNIEAEREAEREAEERKEGIREKRKKGKGERGERQK